MGKATGGAGRTTGGGSNQASGSRVGVAASADELEGFEVPAAMRAYRSKPTPPKPKKPDPYEKMVKARQSKKPEYRLARRYSYTQLQEMFRQETRNSGGLLSKRAMTISRAIYINGKKGY